MINIGALAGLAKGDLHPEQLKKLLAGFGLKVEWQELSEGQRPMAFENAARMAVESNVQAMAIHGTTKQGERIEALILFGPAYELDGQ